MASRLNSYLVVYHATATAMKKMHTATPEEMAAAMQAWNKWGKKCGKRLIEFGSPVYGGINLKGSDAAVPSKRNVTGYSRIKARDIEDAESMLKNHPHLSWAKGCEIEVHEIKPMKM